MSVKIQLNEEQTRRTLEMLWPELVRIQREKKKQKQLEEQEEGKENSKEEEKDKQSEYPVILDSKHIAEILGVSRRYAYEIMELETFPLIRIKSTKRVKRDDFFKWLDDQKQSKSNSV